MPFRIMLVVCAEIFAVVGSLASPFWGLLIFNLIALVATLLYIWVIYSQVVVVRHHWSRSKVAAPKPEGRRRLKPEICPNP